MEPRNEPRWTFDLYGYGAAPLRADVSYSFSFSVRPRSAVGSLETPCSYINEWDDHGCPRYPEQSDAVDAAIRRLGIVAQPTWTAIWEFPEADVERLCEALSTLLVSPKRSRLTDTVLTNLVGYTNVAFSRSSEKDDVVEVCILSNNPTPTREIVEGSLAALGHVTPPTVDARDGAVRWTLPSPLYDPLRDALAARLTAPGR